ncbi:hypothetical protein BJV82DRAFT_71390 [Fennellomyces sp. T-0311]|nr:hypothetical protein BJV82DRAFT_71390 [Fennellomyces sp. T-0311]
MGHSKDLIPGSKNSVKTKKTKDQNSDSKNKKAPTGRNATNNVIMDHEVKQNTENSITVKLEADPDTSDIKVDLKPDDLRRSVQEISDGRGKDNDNIRNIVYTLAKGGFLRLNGPVSTASRPSYQATIQGGEIITLNFEQVMAATFIYRFSPIPYIFYKDGHAERSVSDKSNKIICRDLDTLRELEIERLKILEPDARYIRVNNMDDELTFNRYLVSDTGNVHSLFYQRHLVPRQLRSGYLSCTLVSDLRTGIMRKSKQYWICHIVKQSFDGLPMDSHMICHINSNRKDNSLQNLKFLTANERQSLVFSPPSIAARNALKEQGEYPEGFAKPSIPPVTSETKWRPIGTLPWNGKTFSRYEVSNMGHVRKADTKAEMRYWYSQNGSLQVSLYPDNDSCTKPQRVQTHQVARLVANAFVEQNSSTQTAKVVIHRNHDRSDNRAENLAWVEKTSSLTSRRSRKVVAYLKDNPEVTKEYSSCKKAEIDLGCYLRKKFAKGEIVDRIVIWDGENKAAKIQIF